MRCNRPKHGFTLLEAMVASIIGAFIALVAVGTLRTVTAAKTRVNDNITLGDELRFAVNIMRRDMLNLYRDTESDKVKFFGVIEETEFGPVKSLTMRIVGSAKARADQPEGDVYEVQYSLSKDGEDSVLLRRLCPIVGIEDDIETQGGMLVTLAENILDFDIQYFDGTEWVPEWPREMTMLPDLVQVIITTPNDEDVELKDLVSRSFMVNFPRTSVPQEGEANSENEGNG